MKLLKVDFSHNLNEGGRGEAGKIYLAPLSSSNLEALGEEVEL